MPTGLPFRPIENAYPGPQRRVRRFRYGTVFIPIICLVIGLLFIQAIIHENQQKLQWRPLPVFGTDLWALQILDNKSCATIIVGLLSLAFLNRQLTLAYRPVFNYRSQQTSSSIFALCKNSTKTDVWHIQLQNVGSGPAIVRKSWYRVAFQPLNSTGYESYGNSISTLVGSGLVNGEDFVIRFLSSGWALAAKEECVIAEIALAKAMNIYALDIKVEFAGLLGDTYIKELFCIPRMGIYPPNPHAPKSVETTKDSAGTKPVAAGG